MTRGAFALALAFVGGVSTAWAQEPAENLRIAMDVLPSTVFTPTALDVARYIDMSLLADMHNGRLDQSALTRARTGSSLRPFDALGIAGPDQWSDLSGIAIADLQFLAAYGQPPQEALLWGFADPATAAAAFDGLSAKGFSQIGLLPGVIANGDPGVMNIAQRDPANPWRGMLGQTSIVMRAGQTLLHAVDAASFAPATGGTSMSETAAGKALLAAMQAQDGAVLQAYMFGPYLGFHSGFDPATLMTATPDEARERLEAAMDEDVPGVPFYTGAMLADIVNADGATLLIALAYADCQTADQASARAAELWPLSAGGNLEGTPMPGYVDAGDAGCAAVITIPGGPGNVQYGRAFSALVQRDLAAVRIAPE